MTLADSGAYCLTRLFPSTIFHQYILIWARPSMLLESTSFKNSFVCKDEVVILSDDLVDLFTQLYGLIGILLV